VYYTTTFLKNVPDNVIFFLQVIKQNNLKDLKEEKLLNNK